MHLDTSSIDNRERSPALAALGVGLAILAVIAFVSSGHVPHLVGALAFAAMAPAWYLLPSSLFTAPLKGQIKRPRYFPRWAQVLAGAGIVLLFVSIGLRWAAS